MDAILSDLTASDFKRKLGGVAKLKTHLQSNKLKHSSWGGVVSVLMDVMRDNNFKLGLGAIDCMCLLAEQMDSSGKLYVDSIMPPLIKRMGDSKARVRQRAVDLAMLLMGLADPASVIDKLRAASKHKSAKVREQYLKCLSATLNTHGSEALSMSLLLPRVVEMLADGQSPVRDAAMETLEIAHALDPEPVEVELDRGTVRATQLKALRKRFSKHSAAAGAGGRQAHAHTIAGEPSASPVHAAPRHRRNGSNGRGGGGSKDSHGRTAPPRHGGPRPSSAAPSHARHPSHGDDHSVSSTASSHSSHRPRNRRPGTAPLSRTAKSGTAGSLASLASSATDVEPVSVYSERELVREVDGLVAVLGTTTKAWDERIRALERFRGLLVGGATEFGAFPSLVTQLREPLQTQVTDLRSAVARAACTAVSELALTMGPAFEPHAGSMVHTLLRLTIVTIQVISASGDQCIRTILQCTQEGFPRVIPKFLDAIAGRNAALRSHCMVYLLLALMQWDTHAFDRHVSALQKTLRRALGDAVESVRACARQAFWAFAQHYPDRATRIMDAAEPSTQRLLHQDEHKVGTIAAHGGVQWGEEEDEGDALHADGGGGLDDDGEPYDDGGYDEAEPLHTERGRGGSRTYAGAGAEDSVGQGGGYSQHGHGHGHGLGPTHRAVRRSPPRSHGEKPSEHTRHPSVGSTGSGASAHHGRSPKHSPIKHDGGRWEDGRGHGAHPAMGKAARRRPRTQPPGGDRGGGSGGGGGDKPAAAAGSRLGGAVRVQHTHGAGTGKAAGAPASSQPSHTDEPPLPLTHVLQDCGSDVWSERVHALQDVAAMCSAGGGRRHELVAHLDAVVRVLLDRVADPHFKVVHASLQALAAAVRALRAHMEPHLPMILPEAVTQLMSGKRVVRDAAAALVDTMRQCFLGSQLAPLAVRVLDTPSTGARVGALDLLVNLLSQADVVAHFYSAPRMRVFVDKLGMVLTSQLPDPTGAARKVAGSCLVALHGAHSAGFITAVASCSSAKQAAIIRATTARVPDIGEQLALHMHSSAAAGGGSGGAEDFGDGPGAGHGAGAPPRGAAPPPVPSHAGHRAEQGLGARNGAGGSLSTRGRDDRRSGEAAASHAVPPQLPLGGASHGLVIPGVSAGAGSFSVSSYAAGGKYSSVLTPGAANGHGGGSSSSSEVSGLLALLGERSDAATKRAALHQIGVLAAQDSLALRPPFFGQVLAVVLETLGRDPAAVLLAALPVIRRLLRHQGAHFDDFVELVVARLLECTRHPEKEVTHASERTLDLLVTVVDPKRCMEVIAPVVNAEHSDVLQSAIHMLGRIVTRLPSQELVRQLPHVLPGLLRAFNSQKADVRKACVFCLVDMYMSIGDSLFAHLTALTQSQLKLLTIYINRTLKSRDAPPGRGASSRQ